MDRQLGAFLQCGPEEPRIAAGCMTGTSVDALDVAWVRATGRGLELRAELLEHRHLELGELRAPLRRLAAQEPFSAQEIARLAHGLGALHARALVPRSAVDAPPLAQLVAVHGQTVAHDGEASWALFDPAPLLPLINAPIVTDLRLVDRSADGEGAPITPLADWVLLRGPRPRAVINLGGFCNATFLPAESGRPEHVTGGDLTPCNQLLDAAARRWLDAPFDRDGEVAAAGRVEVELGRAVEQGLRSIGGRGRSLGTGDEGFGLLDGLAALGAADALATVVDAVATTIAAALPAGVEVLLFGGGARNRTLVQALRARLPERPVTVGGPPASRLVPEAREAACMAVLGLLAADGVRITLPAVTGRGETYFLDGRWLLPR